MKKVVPFFLTVIAIAALSAYGTLHWMSRPADPGDISAHNWLHQELRLSPEQHAALAPIEARFAEQQQRLVNALHAANRRLATAIDEDKSYSVRVSHAVEQVHLCMSDLQKASIQHIFEMRSVLSEEQGARLLTLARQSLEQAP